MNYKFIGILLIGISCSAFGFFLAANTRKNLLYIQEFIDILNYMECELNFHLTTLPNLCRMVAEKSKSLGVVFSDLANELDNQISPDVSTCMAVAVRKYRHPSEDMRRLLLKLGDSLGKFDLQGQLLEIQELRQKCIRMRNEGEVSKNNRIRCYRTLGVCAGATIIIILL